MELIRKLRRVLKKPPKFIVERIFSEISIFLDRFFYSRPDKISLRKFLKIANSKSLNDLWERHKQNIFLFESRSSEEFSKMKNLNPEFEKKILNKAELVIQRRVQLLGTDEIFLGQPICWNRDFKTNVEWKNRYYRDINYVNFDDNSDVKIPWEISRMHWLIPICQAYVITRDDTFAQFTKEVITEWIEANPYGHSVNWTCTMEVALRIISLEFFFYFFNSSKAWQDEEFQFSYLKNIYFHAFFTERNLEKSDINGNHYTADAAGLVFAGYFLKEYKHSEKYLLKGFNILYSEIQLQIFSDGVDFEASIPYHRLITELFFYPALYAIRQGKSMPQYYIQRLNKMASFTKSYSRSNGSVPLFGDADDARVFPFGSQDINDHLYLPLIIGLTFNNESLIYNQLNTIDEIFWLLGIDAVNKCIISSNFANTSEAFKVGGFYVMNSPNSQIFIDCGPIGLGGRGGHGHNDILSFEAYLNNENIIVDSGSYLYTANYLERNLFRSTSYHNTPMIDFEEINRFITPKDLWNFQNDAKENVIEWKSSNEIDIFKGTHSGFERLENPISPIRTIVFDKKNDDLIIRDVFIGNGKHFVSNPLHFHPHVAIQQLDSQKFMLVVNKVKLYLTWVGVGWICRKENSRYSPSYGKTFDSFKLVFSSKTPLNYPITILISPEADQTNLENKLKNLLTII